FGIYKMDEGEVYYEGEKVNITDPMMALNQGIAMVHQELQPIPERSVAENIYIGRYPMKKLLGFIPIIDHEQMYKNTQALLEKVHMNFDPRQKLGTLSVSQMQSVEIAKAVSADCKVLILDEPTRGIDVGAKYEIYCIIADLAKQGKSIIMISSEMGELIGMSDRIMVMCDGRVTGIVDGKDATQENIMALATQFE
ncbi:MAG: ATP-binding cassette domain-containing protein, partial [Ruthenibacterium sp.]